MSACQVRRLSRRSADTSDEEEREAKDEEAEDEEAVVSWFMNAWTVNKNVKQTLNVKKTEDEACCALSCGQELAIQTPSVASCASLAAGSARFASEEAKEVPAEALPLDSFELVTSAAEQAEFPSVGEATFRPLRCHVLFSSPLLDFQ